MRPLLPMLFVASLLTCSCYRNQIEDRLTDLEREVDQHCTTADLEAWADSLFASHPILPPGGDDHVMIKTNEWHNAILALSKNRNGSGVEISYGSDGRPQELNVLLSLRPMYSIHIGAPHYSPESGFVTNVFRYRKLSGRVYISRSVRE